MKITQLLEYFVNSHNVVVFFFLFVLLMLLRNK